MQYSITSICLLALAGNAAPLSSKEATNKVSQGYKDHKILANSVLGTVIVGTTLYVAPKAVRAYNNRKASKTGGSSSDPATPAAPAGSVNSATPVSPAAYVDTTMENDDEEYLEARQEVIEDLRNGKDSDELSHDESAERVSSIHATAVNIGHIPPRQALEALYKKSKASFGTGLNWENNQVQATVEVQLQTSRPSFDYLGRKYLKCSIVKNSDGTHTIQDRGEYDSGNGEGKMQEVIEDLRNGKDFDELSHDESAERAQHVQIVNTLMAEGMPSEARKWAREHGVPVPSVPRRGDETYPDEDFYPNGEYPYSA